MIAAGKTSYELGWKVKVMLKKQMYIYIYIYADGVMGTSAAIHCRCEKQIQGGVPGSFVGDPRAYQDQIRGFELHRGRTRRNVFLPQN